MVFNAISKLFKSFTDSPEHYLTKPNIKEEKIIKLLKKNSIKKIMEKPVLIESKTKKDKLIKIARRHPTAKLFVVTNKRKKVIGTIHEDELFVMMVPNTLYDEVGVGLATDLYQKFFAKTAKDIMRHQFEFCYDYEDITKIALKFLDIEVNEMVVLNKDNKVVGVITQGILLRHLYHNHPKKKKKKKRKSKRTKK